MKNQAVLPCWLSIPNLLLTALFDLNHYRINYEAIMNSTTHYSKIKGTGMAWLMLALCTGVPIVSLPSYASATNIAGIVLADRTISGQVTSQTDDTPMPGVNVLVKGSTTGTTTDANGRFSMSIGDQAGQVLIFSYIGYTPQELQVGNQSIFNVVLAESNETLQEVVVTALGISKDKKALGYSVGEVKGKDIVNVPQENVVNALAGRVAGVTINQTSGAGSSVSVIIRGATSLSNDNQPLFVIDGVPVANGLNNTRSMGDRNNVDYGNAISDINPDDIENISVLKGPSAAALYGSRAGNGVIMITTKSGKKGKGLGVSFSTSNVFEKPYRYLDLHYKYANGARNNALTQGSAYWGGPTLDAGNTAVQWNSPIGADGNPVATPLLSYKDNMKNFLQTGITSTNNLAISGSSDKAVYRVSYNYMANQGLIPNSDLKRHSISASGEYQLHKSLTLSSNLNFSKNGADNRPSTANRGANPLEAVYAHSNVNVLDLKDYWMPGAEHVAQRVPSSNVDNPYFLAYGINNGFNRDRVYGNLKLDWTINPKFSAFARISHDQFSENRETKIPLSYTRGRNGGYYMQGINRQETNLDFLATYQEKINDFDIRISGGANSMRISASDFYMGGATLTVPGLYRISNVPQNALSASNGASEKAIYSLLGTAVIGYKDQLYLDLAARNDWSSTLPASNRSYFYPAASLSWLPSTTFNLPQEISLLKVRASWAKSGNDTSPYQLVPTLGTGSWGPVVTTGVPGTLLNSNLKPEIATAQEYGFDLNLYDNRIRFEATYYYMENKNQILSIQTPGSSGFSSKLINAGLLSSKGVELNLGTSPIRDLNGWNLDVNVNFTRNRTKIKELAPGVNFFQLWDDNGGGAFTYVGEEIGNLYSRGYAKVTDPTSPYYLWPILDNNGEWIAQNDREDREKVGNFNPKFMMGSQINLSYKRFNLSASFDWRAGGNFQSYTYRYGESDWKSQRQIDNLIPGGNYSPDELAALLKSDPEKYIIPQNGNFPRVGGHTKETGGMPLDDGFDGAFIPGVIAITNAEGQITGYKEHLGGEDTKVYPVTDTYPWSYNKQITFDASFIKLREISFGYNLPAIKGFNNVNVSVFSRNIMLWTASKIGIDPERAFQADGGRFRQGIELQNVMPWTIPVGFKINFSL